MSPLRLGIVGCGAIVETGHLPATLLTDNVKVNALVDTSLDQARKLAAQYQVPRIDADYQAIQEYVDAVLIATPSHLHVEHAGFFLERGVPVLCEKPLANDTAGCQQLVDLAAQHQVKLAVGQVRRFFFYAEQLKALVDQGRLGPVQEIHADEGYPYGWPARTDHAFQRHLVPGGVTLDLGVHLLDLFTWLLGPITGLRYADDAIGGVESNAEAFIDFASGAHGRFRLSRTCERPNRLVVVGSQGQAEASVYVPGELTVHLHGTRRPTHLRASPGQTLISALAGQLTDFQQAIVEDRAPRTAGLDGLAAVQLVEQCYRQARGRSLPKEAPIPGVVRWS